MGSCLCNWKERASSWKTQHGELVRVSQVKPRNIWPGITLAFSSPLTNSQSFWWSVEILGAFKSFWKLFCFRMLCLNFIESFHSRFHSHFLCLYTCFKGHPPSIYNIKPFPNGSTMGILTNTRCCQMMPDDVWTSERSLVPGRIMLAIKQVVLKRQTDSGCLESESRYNLPNTSGHIHSVSYLNSETFGFVKAGDTVSEAAWGSPGTETNTRSTCCSVF